MPTDVLTPPIGFKPYDRRSPLIEPWGPIYARVRPDRLVLGLFVDRAHMNSRDCAHGGLIAALADQAMGVSCGVGLRTQKIEAEGLWTTSLTVDYLAPAKAGQWLTFDTFFARIGKTICHAEADIAADWETIARARGAFRVTHKAHVSSSS